MELLDFSEGHGPVRICGAAGYEIFIVDVLMVGGQRHDYIILHNTQRVFISAKYVQFIIHHHLVEPEK